ncbi:chromosomal replication initiator DnaA [Roseovarius tibetensis]|uniref:chromosomal replication initiator DnaA n=1 Tax=Roseovarius tibetensis TaxID=2685897 RepID=UPI003D7F5DE3
MAEQLSFDLPVRAALGREDFFVSPANSEAVATIEGWQGWPSHKLILTGPAGAGKTHLAHVWAGLSGAGIVAARDLARSDVAQLGQGCVVVEDAQDVAGHGAAQDALFHLHNLIQAEGRALLVTARTPPHLWGLTLPDLASRLQGTLHITLHPPDDALLSAVLMKLFADRQLMPSPDTIPFLAKRMERSFEAAERIVADLDATALAQRRSITRGLAGEVLDNHGE